MTVQKIKEKRAAQMAARLKAVKRRKKEKLGLPVDSSSGKYIELYEGWLTISMPIFVSALATCHFELMKQKSVVNQITYRYETYFYFST